VTVDELRRAQSYLGTFGSAFHCLSNISREHRLDAFKLLQLRRLFALIIGKRLFETLLLIIRADKEETLRLTFPDFNLNGWCSISRGFCLEDPTRSLNRLLQLTDRLPELLSRLDGVNVTPKPFTGREM